MSGFCKAREALPERRLVAQDCGGCTGFFRLKTKDREGEREREGGRDERERGRGMKKKEM